LFKQLTHYNNCDKYDKCDHRCDILKIYIIYIFNIYMAPKTLAEICQNTDIEQYKADADVALTQLSDLLDESDLNPSDLSQTLAQLTSNCDTACQNKKKLELLYGNFASNDCQALKDKARENLLKALNARGNNNDYSLLAPSIKKELDDLLNEYTDELTTLVNTNNSNLNAYSAMYNSYGNIKELSESTIKENKKLKKEVDNILKFTHTGERKLWYKFQSISKQQFYFTILILIYYILILIFVVKEINNSNNTNNFEDIYFLSKIVILLLLPLLLGYISIVFNYIVSLFESIHKLF